MKKKYATAQPSSIPPDQVLTTQALTKAYFQGDYHIKAVDSVYLNVKKGEFVAIVGASGSGSQRFFIFSPAWTARPLAWSGSPARIYTI